MQMSMTVKLILSAMLLMKEMQSHQATPADSILDWE